MVTFVCNIIYCGLWMLIFIVNLPTLKVFALNFTLLVCNQLSGSFAIFNYTSHIFSELETAMDANTCTIIVGAAQVIGILCAVGLVDRLGRRVLLLTSMAGMGIGELGIALLAQLASKEFLTEVNWLSLLLMCWVAFIASIGVIPLIFVIIIENLPAKVSANWDNYVYMGNKKDNNMTASSRQIRSIGTSICMATLSTFIFVSLKIYPLMIFGPGLAATMYMSAGVCGIGLTILGLFLPETKGKLLTHWLFVAAYWMTSTWLQAPSPAATPKVTYYITWGWQCDWVIVSLNTIADTRIACQRFPPREFNQIWPQKRVQRTSSFELLNLIQFYFRVFYCSIASIVRKICIEELIRFSCDRESLKVVCVLQIERNNIIWPTMLA